MIVLARTAAEAGQHDGGGPGAGDAGIAAADGAAGGGSDAVGPTEGEHTSFGALSPQARRALRHAMARLAVDLVSGPAGLAAALRRGLLGKPYDTPSLPLDIGHSHAIPGHIRRAVLLRDRTCAWPHCDRPAAHCDVHHLRHQAHGGPTSLANCVLVCQFHHDVCIHRKGWQLTLHPDGTTEARSPDGHQVLHSHAAPAQNVA
jgi:hypothetical protein